MSNLQVAETIIKQMGGAGRLQLMIGASLFAGDEKSVQFSFKGCRKANKCRVTLQPDDLYTLELFKFDGLDAPRVYHTDGLFWDMLKPVFEQETGLYLSL